MGLRGPEGPQTPFRSPKPWLWWLQPAPNTSPQIPARRELHIQSLGLQPTSWIISTPHPEPAPLLLPRFLSLHPGVPGPCSLPPPQPPGPPPGCRLPALQAQPPSAAPSCGSPGPTHSGQTPAPARWPTWPTRSVPWRWHCQHHQTQLRPFHPLPQGSACLQLRPQFPQFRLRPPPSPSPGSPGDRPGQQAGSQGCLRNLAPTPFTRAWAPEAQEGALPSLPRPSSSAGPEAWPRQTPAEGARAQARTPNAPASWGSLPGAQCSAGPAPTPPGPALRQGWPGATTGSGQPFAQGLS